MKIFRRMRNAFLNAVMRSATRACSWAIRKAVKAVR
jgi:hypothetical protein|nr:MAG TPA: hypothetical protein [Inoviridae sp.]